MAQINLQIPQVGQPAASEDPKIASDFSTVQSAINGGLDSTNLASPSGIMLTASGSAGASNVSASQSTSSASYTTLSTPDQVTGLVLPTNGLFVVWLQATWQESVMGAARAAIFLNGNQIVQGLAGSATQSITATEALIGASGAAGHDIILSSCPQGLASLGQESYSGAYVGDSTTGQLVGGGFPYAPVLSEIYMGGPAHIFAAAGTYTVSVKFKTSSGTVTAKNRKLWVQVLPFQ